MERYLDFLSKAEAFARAEAGAANLDLPEFLFRPPGDPNLPMSWVVYFRVGGANYCDCVMVDFTGQEPTGFSDPPMENQWNDAHVHHVA